MNTQIRLAAAVAALSFAHAQAGNTVVLESFEDNIDNAEVVTEGGRASLASHTKTGADDDQVTEGAKSLKVTIKGTAGWGRDLNVTLDEKASKLIADAFATKELARWVVRYDMTFPDTGDASPSIAWMVNSGALNGFERGQLEANGGRLRTMSFPLDLLAEEGVDLAAGDPVVIRITTNFGTKADDWGSTDYYIDNIRLVDNYAAGAKPVATLINSFETDADLAKIVHFDNWNVAERYELKLHSKTGDDDLAVTHGSKSLEVKINANGDWAPDYEFNFSGTAVAEALKAPQERRSRYTLRWDVVFEDTAATGNWNGNWQNYILWLQNGAGNYALGRRENAQHVRTYNLVLDEVNFPEPNPDNPDDQASWIGVVNQGAWNAPGMTMHIDNIRLIDTGAASAAPSAPVLSGFALDRATSTVNVQWKSNAGAKYDVEESTNLKDWKAAGGGLTGQAGNTSYSQKQDSLARAKFFRVRAK